MSGDERPTTTPRVVPAAYAWQTNGHLIADVAQLGYLAGHVCDLTYGEGGFWTVWRPDQLTCHDKYRGDAVDGVDFRSLPEADGTYDTVVFDPPYKLNGTPALGQTDVRYGTNRPMRWQTRMVTILRGTKEAVRVTKAGGHTLVKCQDQVVSGHVRWQTQLVTAMAQRNGARLVDRFDLLDGGRSQPADRRQVHAHGRPSTLLVFRKAQ